MKRSRQTRNKQISNLIRKAGSTPKRVSVEPQPMPSQKSVIANMKRRQNKRNQQLLAKPQPSRIDAAIQEITELADKHGFRRHQERNQTVAPACEGFDCLEEIAKRLTQHKRYGDKRNEPP